MLRRAGQPPAHRHPGGSGRGCGGIAAWRGQVFGDQAVLEDVNLDLRAGSVTVLIGPSGAGKSTLLRLINHLERADSGYVTVGYQLIGYRREGDTLYELPEREIRRRRSEVGMVFQGFNLFPHLTALENIIEAPIAVRGVPRAQAVRQARTLLERSAWPTRPMRSRQLSGGQQQRIAIARALALQPKVLFDEPTSALDPELVAEVLERDRGTGPFGYHAGDRHP